MSRASLAILVAAALVAGVGCAGKRPPSGPGGAVGSPERVFDTARDAILTGDADLVFAQYSERKKRIEGGIANFKKNYAANRVTLEDMFTGSKITFVAIDKEQATAVVLWGNGERWPPLAFVREKGEWKIDQ